MSASISLIDIIVYLVLRKGLEGTGKEGDGEGGWGCVARGNFLSAMKVIYWWSIAMTMRLKHDRMLTLIRLFEYRNTGTRVLLVHDKHTTTYIQGRTIHVSNSLHGSHIIQFKHAYFTYIIVGFSFSFF